MQNDISTVKQELNTLIGIIIDTVPVEAIYLFGSYVYGTPHKDSDLDLYIVFKDDMPMRELDALVSTRIAMHKAQNMPIDLLGLKKERFLYRSTGFATIEHEVIHKGVIVYG